MPYVPGFSERFKNSKLYDKEKFCIASKTSNTLSRIYNNMKSKIDNGDKSNVIYEIACKGGDSYNMVYVGTTKSKLKTRISGHKSDYKCRTNISTQKTALTSQFCTIFTYTGL